MPATGVPRNWLTEVEIGPEEGMATTSFLVAENTLSAEKAHLSKRVTDTSAGRTQEGSEALAAGEALCLRGTRGRSRRRAAWGPNWRYALTMTEREKPSLSAANQAVRVRRLREDARRSPTENLAETIALSHELLKFAGAAKHN